MSTLYEAQSLATGLIHLTIPGQPIAKARPRLGRYGNTYTPPKTAEAEGTIRRLFLAAGYRVNADAGASFCIVLKCYFKGKPISDVDNLLKLFMDAFNGIIWRDDRQVVRAVVEKYWGDPNPRTEARIWAT